MKSSFLINSLIIAFCLAGCGNNQDAAGKNQDAAASSAEKKAEAVSAPSSPGDDIFGEWELVGSIVDTNDNLLIDEEERKNLKQASYKDYMTLNKDGTGLFTIARMEGRYELTDKDGKGKQSLTWYDTGNGRHRVGTIVSVTKEEMQIKEPGGSGLLLWKRL